jgi:hypothetical protein
MRTTIRLLSNKPYNKSEIQATLSLLFRTKPNKTSKNATQKTEKRSNTNFTKRGWTHTNLTKKGMNPHEPYKKGNEPTRTLQKRKWTHTNLTRKGMNPYEPYKKKEWIKVLANGKLYSSTIACPACDNIDQFSWNYRKIIIIIIIIIILLQTLSTMFITWSVLPIYEVQR